MSLDPQRRRELLRAAHSLKARITIGKDGLSDALVAQVRQALAKAPLLKVRIHAADRDAVDALGRELARRVPCDWIGRLGFVVTLSQSADTADA
ncbi:MAG: YhbY family RNA-binding protein [Phycisphaerae bacterium]